MISNMYTESHKKEENTGSERVPIPWRMWEKRFEIRRLYIAVTFASMPFSDRSKRFIVIHSFPRHLRSANMAQQNGTDLARKKGFKSSMKKFRYTAAIEEVQNRY